MKTILLISSGQPSANPRLVKEADILAESGYEVIVLYSFWTNWAWHADLKLFQNVNWTPILRGGIPTERIVFGKTRIRFKFFNFLARFFTHNFGIAEVAKARAYSELLRRAKTIKVDLYIAHNLAALPIAVKAAKLHNAKCGFDAEDFHRQEVSDNIHSKEYKLAKYLEDKYLPQVDYITAASPLIATEYKKLYPNLNPIVINNVFNKRNESNNTKLKTQNSKLQLFWFSQTIGKGRGLEDVIKAIGILKNENISFTLLGNVTTAVQEYLMELASANGLQRSQLIFLDPIAPDYIFSLASQFDLGMALEQIVPYNRDICLTNKIFTYIVSGIGVIASETQAQKQFMQSYPAIGKTYAIGDIQKLAEIIQHYYNNREELQKAKQAAHELGKNELNWENESKKFFKIVNDVLNGSQKT